MVRTCFIEAQVIDLGLRAETPRGLHGLYVCGSGDASGAQGAGVLKILQLGDCFVLESNEPSGR